MANVKSRKRQGLNGETFEGYNYGPNVAVVKMTSPDGGTAWVHASVPGGYPMFSIGSPTEPSVYATRCSSAPEVSNLSELLDFAVARFGQVDEPLR